MGSLGVISMKKLFVGVFLFAVVLGAGVAAPSQIQTPPRARFVQTVLANFSSWDLRGDGVLDEDVVTRLVQNPEITGEAAAAVTAIKSALVADGRDDFPPLTHDYFASNDKTINGFVRFFKTGEKRILEAHDQPIFTNEGPTLSGCKQGALGDCYLVAATGAVVARDPSAVMKLMTPSGDGYRLTYPDGYWVQVPALTQGELALGGAGTENGLWLRLLEKSWGVRLLTSSKRRDKAADPHDVISGGSGKYALEAMTGFEARQYHLLGSLKVPPISPVDDLRVAVANAMQTRHLAIAGTNREIRIPGINRSHCYAVIGYDATSDTVQLWNPHVNNFKPKGPDGPEFGYTTIEGRFSIPMVVFENTFSGVAIETDQPTSGIRHE